MMHRTTTVRLVSFVIATLGIATPAAWATAIATADGQVNFSVSLSTGGL